jgi:hypothetical protein
VARRAPLTVAPPLSGAGVDPPRLPQETRYYRLRSTRENSLPPDPAACPTSRCPLPSLRTRHPRCASGAYAAGVSRTHRGPAATDRGRVAGRASGTAAARAAPTRRERHASPQAPGRGTSLRTRHPRCASAAYAAGVSRAHRPAQQRAQTSLNGAGGAGRGDPGAGPPERASRGGPERGRASGAGRARRDASLRTRHPRCASAAYAAGVSRAHLAGGPAAGAGGRGAPGGRRGGRVRTRRCSRRCRRGCRART